MRRTLFTILLPMLVATLTAPVSAGEASPSSGSPYVEPSAYLDDDGIDAWYGIRRRLLHDFDQICGDTFCEGDFTNIQSLRFQCSVHRLTGALGACAWSFAASDEQIGTRGRITSQPMAWQCIAPLAPRTTIHEYLAALDVDEPLYQPLPRGAPSLFDMLVDCL